MVFSNKRKRKDNGRRGRPKKMKRGIGGGRKRINAEEGSKSTLYRRAYEILEYAEYNTDLLKLAIQLANKWEKNSCEERLTDGTAIQEDININVLIHSKESAFAFYLENGYSVKTYTALREDCIQRNVPIYPPYKSFNDLMSECQPKITNASEVQILTSTQCMLNKTAERLCNAVADNWAPRSLRKLQLIVTVGFDSSSGYKNSHQNCKNVENECLDAQQSLFVTNMLIVKLGCTSFSKYNFVWLIDNLFLILYWSHVKLLKRDVIIAV